ncbi:DUF4065 domain-containing protein [Coriobacteriaceae bacterium]|nr:DUF4065 domain-containing protein [Coriobacteriaceae bacterium]
MKAIDVARYLLDEHGTMTAYKLQKLLYYAQAWNLVANGSALFDDEIMAWGHGPVVPEVFSEHAGFRNVSPCEVRGDVSAVPVDVRCQIEEFIRPYLAMSGDELVALTHSERPWSDAYPGTGSISNSVISSEAMSDYYTWLYNSSEAQRSDHHVPWLPERSRIVLSPEEYDWLESVLA